MALLTAFMTISDCIDELVATINVPSLFPVAKFTGTIFNKLSEVLEMFVLYRAKIVIRAHSAV